jgi:hypothetical protein
MSLKCSPAIAQAVMENVLLGSDMADVCIDDVGASPPHKSITLSS